MSDDWVAASLLHKGIEPGAPASAEEWIAGPMSRSATSACCGTPWPTSPRHGSPRIPGPVWTRPDGRVAAGVFPASVWDRLFYAGVTAEVWMQPGVAAPGLGDDAGRGVPDGGAGGQVVLVLGAGNVSSIGPLDALYKLFVENHVVLYKAHPVNDYLGPLMERALPAPGGPRSAEDRVRRRRRGRVPVPASGRRRDPHHRLRQDLRGDRLRRGRGGRASPGRAAAAPDQAGHGRAGEREPGDRGARAVERRRRPLSGGQPGLDADQQRGVQLQRDARDRAARRRGRSARPCSTPCAPCWRGCRHAAPTIPAPRDATRPSGRRTPGRSGSGRTRTAACRGRWFPASTPAEPATSVSTPRHSAGCSPRPRWRPAARRSSSTRAVRFCNGRCGGR